MKINVRSPYHINIATANLTSCLLDLYVYTGTQTTDRGAIKYTISSTAHNEEVTFEISEFVRDYLDVTFDGTYTSEMVWVDYQTTQYVSESVQTPDTLVALSGFDGYGYFEEGVNPQLDASVLMSNSLIYKLDDAPLRVPINQNNVSNVTFSYEGETVYSETITSTSESTDEIRYISDATGSVDSYSERVINDGGTFETSKCLTEFLSTIILYPVDTVYVDSTILKVINVEECKHTPHKVTFINKFGAKQDLWFFKRTDTSISTSKTDYKSNIINSGSYNVNEHQTKILTKQGKEKLVLNSGFVDEQMNEVFRQLMLSEKVWIEVNNQTLPINISSSSLSFKTSLNDKLINYTIEIEYAFNKINNIR